MTDQECSCPYPEPRLGDEHRGCPIHGDAAQLAAVIEALNWAKAPTTDDVLAGIAVRLRQPDHGYSPAGRVRALYSRERMEANRQRHLVAEAREIIDGMTEWMRCALPSQVEPGTDPERQALLLAARKWNAAEEDQG